MSETHIARGATFEAQTHPTDEFIVLETADISGYEAVRVAERDGDTWHDYWSKAQYLLDEANLGASTPTGTISEDLLTAIEDAL